MTNRAHFSRLVQDAEGNVLIDADITVCDNGTTTPITADLYVDDTSASLLSNPYTCADGRIEFYLLVPTRVTLLVQAPAQVPQTYDNIDVEPPAGFVDSVVLRAPNGTTFWTLSVGNDGHLQAVSGVTTKTFTPDP